MDGMRAVSFLLILQKQSCANCSDAFQSFSTNQLRLSHLHILPPTYAHPHKPCHHCDETAIILMVSLFPMLNLLLTGKATSVLFPTLF